MAFETAHNTTVLVNSSVTYHATNVSLAGTAGAQPIETLKGGLVGFSKGAGSVTLTLDLAVLLSGTEFDWFGAMKSLETVNIQFSTGGGKSYNGNGVCTDVTYSQAVASPTSCSVTWTGELVDLT